MSSGEWIAVIGAIGVVLVNLVTAWRTESKVQALQNDVENNAARSDDKAVLAQQAAQLAAGRIDGKLGEIHQLTNSNLSSVKAELASANDRLQRLEEALAGKVEAIAGKDQALLAKDQALAEKDQAIAEKDQAIAEKDQAIAVKEQTIAAKDAVAVVQDQTIAVKDVAAATAAAAVVPDPGDKRR